jgi:hypothetical protein
VNNALLRTLLTYAIILPLAIFIGWNLSGDMTRSSFAVLAVILFFLLLPLILKWHYPVMLFSWSTSITIFFLPGKPTLWMLMAGLNFGLAIFNRIISKKPAFLPAPSITLSLLFLTAVVAWTAKVRGGLGVSALGSDTYGGKSYYVIFAGIIGYFAFASQTISAERAKFYIGLFFLPGIAAAISNLIYIAGPSFYFLYILFPMSFAGVQAGSEMGGISRIAGFSVSAVTVSFYLLAANGIRGLFVKWWRLLLLIVVMGLGSLGGYRSLLVLVGLVFAILFLVEGLLRSPIFPALLLVLGLLFAALFPFASKLPQSVQRTLSILPLKIDPMIRYEAQGSIDWRLEIWRAVVPDLPKYFWLGKGYAINPTDLYLTEQANLRGRSQHTEGALVTGDYHSGPLSVYVPFGVFGSLAFLVFLGVSLRALYLNYRYGREEVRTLNRFLFAYFLGRAIFFFGAFGALPSDLYQFTAAIGFGIALNKGICRKPVTVPMPVRVRGNLQLRPAEPGVA